MQALDDYASRALWAASLAQQRNKFMKVNHTLALNNHLYEKIYLCLKLEMMRS